MHFEQGKLYQVTAIDDLSTRRNWIDHLFLFKVTSKLSSISTTSKRLTYNEDESRLFEVGQIFMFLQFEGPGISYLKYLVVLMDEAIWTTNYTIDELETFMKFEKML